MRTKRQKTNDIKYGKKHEHLVKPVLEELFGKLKMNDTFNNFDFSNKNFYVEHKKRNIKFRHYDSLIFDKVKYDKYLELKKENKKLQFFIVWSCSDRMYMWEFSESKEEFYIRDKYDVDKGCWDNTKQTICVLNEYISPFNDFERKVKKK
jgi:hypothetical protein